MMLADLVVGGLLQACLPSILSDGIRRDAASAKYRNKRRVLCGGEDRCKSNESQDSLMMH